MKSIIITHGIISGNNFTATTGGGPPPKPAPPSFPNSPTGISPMKVTTSVVGPAVVSASPSIPASGIGKK